MDMPARRGGNKLAPCRHLPIPGPGALFCRFSFVRTRRRVRHECDGSGRARAAFRRGRNRRDCASLSGRDVPQQGLAHAPRHHDQLGGSDHRDRHIGDLQQRGGIPSAGRPGIVPGRGVPDLRGAALPLLRCLAHPRAGDGDQLLRPDAARRGVARRQRMEPGAGRRLHRRLLPHQLLGGGGSPSSAQLLLDLRRPGGKLLGQASDPADAARLAGGALGARRHRPAARQLVLLIGTVFYAGLLFLGIYTLRGQRAVGRGHRARWIEDRMQKLASTEQY
jgi:hypothetical protein